MLKVSVLALEAYLKDLLDIDDNNFRIAQPEEAFRKNAEANNKILCPFYCLWFNDNQVQIDKSIDYPEYYDGIYVSHDDDVATKKPLVPIRAPMNFYAFFNYGKVLTEYIPFLKNFFFMQRKNPQLTFTNESIDYTFYLNLKFDKTTPTAQRIYEGTTYYEFRASFEYSTFLIDDDVDGGKICLTIDDSYTIDLTI